MTLGRRAQKYMVCTSRRLDFEIRLVTRSEIGTVVRTQEDMRLHRGLQVNWKRVGILAKGSRLTCLAGVLGGSMGVPGDDYNFTGKGLRGRKGNTLL